MPLMVNLRHLAERAVTLKGELPAGELDIDTHDEMVRVSDPWQYDLEVEMVELGLLVRGRLQLTLRCQCVRCLKRFPRKLELSQWVCHLALQGGEPVAVVNDCVDLTPWVREDMLLEFPQHPLCKPECRGFEKIEKKTIGRAGTNSEKKAAASAWGPLDKLKL